MKFLHVVPAVLAIAAKAQAQQPPEYQTVPVSVSSGVHAVQGEQASMVFEHAVVVSGAPWIRLLFDRVQLGEKSYLSLFAPRDGGYQVLDATSIAQWRRSTAIFNGDTVVVQLFAAPGDLDVSFNLGWAMVGLPPGPVPETLCGSDSRTASSDNRVARLYFGGCTAWRVTNGAFVTAGHCVDFDPDSFGPSLPDGVLDLNGVVEFNVPPSTTGGATVFASPNDQYAINVAGVQWRFDGEGQGVGKDWAVFGVFANSNTGLLPHQAYGLPFRVSDASTVGGASIRLIGFGLDSTPPGALGGQNAQTFTNQTSTGPYVGLFTGNTASDIYHEYEVDSTGGSSGSPILLDSVNLVLGVHTTGGCVPGSFGNAGTSLEVNAFFNALHQFPANTVEYADGGYPFTVGENGDVTDPWSTVLQAINDCPTGGRVSIVAGDYSETWTATRAMLLDAPVGSVEIR